MTYSKFTNQENDLVKFAEVVDNMKFKVAKSMPQMPHSYIVREPTASIFGIEHWYFLVEFIREYGYEEPFYSKTYIYFNHNGYKYWTMGAPVEDTIILNRAKL